MMITRKVQIHENDRKEWLKKVETAFSDFEQKKSKPCKRLNAQEIIFSSYSETEEDAHEEIPIKRLKIRACFEKARFESRATIRYQ
jgi:hypothetical protein